MPYIIQIWMYLTPVIYGANLIPQQFRFLLALNPMTAVTEGFRWALLGRRLTDAQPPGPVLVISALIAITVLISGAIFFRRTERTFADII
jgi:lipopolysaccharide transport system permease protein